MTDSQQRPGFGIVGLSLAGFMFVGPGVFFINSGRPIVGWPLAVIGVLPVLYDIGTSQQGLYWRFLIVGLTASVAYSLCLRMAG